MPGKPLEPAERLDTLEKFSLDTHCCDSFIYANFNWANAIKIIKGNVIEEKEIVIFACVLLAGILLMYSHGSWGGDGLVHGR